MHNLHAQAEFHMLLETEPDPQMLPDGAWQALPSRGKFMAGLYWALAAHSHEGVQNLCASIGGNPQEMESQYAAARCGCRCGRRGMRCEGARL
ncbi:MAG: hypothetical protein HY778_14615 [Betaproteobacteria bacterium]|nr:hypothetical protein [Betaproteobacteria bacterium]